MPPKILVVEDFEEMLAVIRRVLSGNDILEALNGAAALALAASEKPDLVLLDVRLPGLSGIGVLKRLMAMDPGPVVIMLTGDSSTETMDEAMALGAFAYITKPFEGQDLVDLVAKGLAFSEKVKARRAG